MILHPPEIVDIRRIYRMWRAAGPRTREGKALYRLLGGLLLAEAPEYNSFLNLAAFYLWDLSIPDLKRSYALAQSQSQSTYDS